MQIAEDDFYVHNKGYHDKSTIWGALESLYVLDTPYCKYLHTEKTEMLLFLLTAYKFNDRSQ